MFSVWNEKVQKKEEYNPLSEEKSDLDLRGWLIVEAGAITGSWLVKKRNQEKQRIGSMRHIKQHVEKRLHSTEHDIDMQSTR